RPSPSLSAVRGSVPSAHSVALSSPSKSSATPTSHPGREPSPSAPSATAPSWSRGLGSLHSQPDASTRLAASRRRTIGGRMHTSGERSWELPWFRNRAFRASPPNGNEGHPVTPSGPQLHAKG